MAGLSAERKELEALKESLNISIFFTTAQTVSLQNISLAGGIREEKPISEVLAFLRTKERFLNNVKVSLFTKYSGAVDWIQAIGYNKLALFQNAFVLLINHPEHKNFYVMLGESNALISSRRIRLRYNDLGMIDRACISKNVRYYTFDQFVNFMAIAFHDYNSDTMPEFV